MLREKAPLYFERTGGRQFVKRAVGGAAVVAAFTAAVTAFPEKRDTDRSRAKAPSQAAAKVILDEDSTQGKHGGLLLDYQIARGINCEPSVPNSLRTDAYYGDAELKNAAQYFGRSDKAMAFVGLNRYRPTTDAYFPLKKGWAVRYAPQGQDYEVYSFVVKPAGSNGDPSYGNIPLGKAEGEKLDAYSLSSLLLNAGVTYGDGEIQFSLWPDWRSADYGTPIGPSIDLEISCVQPGRVAAKH